MNLKQLESYLDGKPGLVAVVQTEVRTRFCNTFRYCYCASQGLCFRHDVSICLEGLNNFMIGCNNG